jgi:peptidyl-tRNA hydrolase
LSIGYQIAQSCHGVQQFAMEHPDINKEWFNVSNYIVVLCVKNEFELIELTAKAEERGIKQSIFEEPDLDNQVTCIVLEPSEDSRKLCSKLPLAPGKCK